VTTARRYLLVDDNLPFAENLAEILDELGAACAVAGSGEEALRALESERFDAVVTDMRMPGMGGAEVVHAVRHVDPGLPVVVLTAHAGDEALAGVRRDGALAVLQKPASVTHLARLLAAARRDGLVAVVDDDPALLDNLAEALRTRGFSVAAASTVEDVARLGPARPLAGLADVRVPGGPDGEAARRLVERFPGLPLLVVTAFPEGAPPERRALFPKPFDTAAVLDEVERLHDERIPSP
jgi:CheY-like chemotaxis protein